MNHDNHNIFEAIQSKNAEAVAAILAIDPKVIGARGLMEMTPLHFAAVRCNPSVVQLLLEKGAEVDARKPDGWTPLHHACQIGDIAVTRLLLQYGADVKARSNGGQTPLHAAAVGVNKLTAAILKTEHSVTNKVMHSLDHERVVRLLIESGADVNARNTSDGETPLLLAAQKGQEAVALALLENGADLNILSVAGWSPLHIAAAICNEGLVKLFLEHGADVEILGKDRQKPRDVIGMFVQRTAVIQVRIADLLGPRLSSPSSEKTNDALIEISGESLNEARMSVPAGHLLICEEVLSDGAPQSIQAASDSIETACQKVRALVSPHAETLSEKVAAEPCERCFYIEAFSEPKALKAVQHSIHSSDAVIAICLEIVGRKGFLSIGRRPNKYKVTVAQAARFEITFRTKPRIRGKLLHIASALALLDSISELRQSLDKTQRGLPGSWAGPEHIRDYVLKNFFHVLASEGKRFNGLLDRAQGWWPLDQELKSQSQLQLGMQQTPYDVAELEKQLSDAKQAVEKLHKNVSTHVKQ